MNNIKNEFIAYEQALELKELGFNEECAAHFLDVDDLELKWKIYRNLSINTNNCLQAPLYQQAFRWLLVLVNKDKHFTNKWTISYNEDYYSLFLGGCNMEVFKAELDCIKYLIELVKTKQI
jgi:hypothetical protein